MELQVKEKIQAPAKEVWAVLAHRFAQIGEWAPHIESSRALKPEEVPEGFEVAPEAPVPGRVTPSPLGEQREVLTEYSEDAMTFTFRVPGPAPLFHHSQNRTTVTSLGGGSSLVTFDLTLQPRGVFKLLTPLLKRRFRTSKFGPAGMIRDLKAYLEAR